MPLPDNEKIVALAEKFLMQFDAIFGLHPGFRPAHAKGMLLKGTFVPSRDAASLSRAAHFSRPSTPVTVRFSNSTGLPLLPDNDANADPRGCAIRFHLAEREHTDIVSHSTDGFPTRTGEEFLEMLQALAANNTSTASPTPLEEFLQSHPSALRFVQTPKPAPSSFAREAYFSVTALRFTNTNGASCYGRYRIVPEAGVEHLDKDATAQRAPTFLFDELTDRIAREEIQLRLTIQEANEGDVVNDSTVHWPEDRRVLNLGAITLTELAADNEKEQRHMIFDPIPRLDGIEPSDDPLLELRAALYLISGRRRRAAEETAATSASAGR